MARRSASMGPILLRDALEILRGQLDVASEEDIERIRAIVDSVVGPRLASEITVGMISDQTIALVGHGSHGSAALRTKIGRIRRSLAEQGYVQRLEIE